MRKAKLKRGAKPPKTKHRARRKSGGPAHTVRKTRARVRAARRPDDADAFLPDPGEGPARAPDELAEVLAENFVASATSGEDQLEDDLEQVLPDEVGGPFVATSAREELADDVDASNPEDATREPLPRAVAGLLRRPRNS